MLKLLLRIFSFFLIPLGVLRHRLNLVPGKNILIQILQKVLKHMLNLVPGKKYSYPNPPEGSKTYLKFGSGKNIFF